MFNIFFKSVIDIKKIWQISSSYVMLNLPHTCKMTMRDSKTLNFQRKRNYGKCVYGKYVYRALMLCSG